VQALRARGAMRNARARRGLASEKIDDQKCVSSPSQQRSSFFLFSSKRKKASDRDADADTVKSSAAPAPIKKRSNARIIRGNNPDSEPVPQSWVWRILKVALPFQLALVALFCAACLLEPHCCEAVNSLNLSFTPQLRYMRGPPPV